MGGEEWLVDGDATTVLVALPPDWLLNVSAVELMVDRNSKFRFTSAMLDRLCDRMIRPLFDAAASDFVDVGHPFSKFFYCLKLYAKINARVSVRWLLSLELILFFQPTLS